MVISVIISFSSFLPKLVDISFNFSIHYLHMFQIRAAEVIVLLCAGFLTYYMSRYHFILLDIVLLFLPAMQQFHSHSTSAISVGRSFITIPRILLRYCQICRADRHSHRTEGESPALLHSAEI